MACDITRGRLIDCKDTIGGLKAIYICKAYNNNISAVANINTTEMTSAGFATWSSASAGATTVFKYDLIPNLSSMTVNINSDNANGTTFFEQTLHLVATRHHFQLEGPICKLFWGIVSTQSMTFKFEVF